MKRFTFFLVFSFLLAIGSYAQERIIKGKVTSSVDDQPLEGVSVAAIGAGNARAQTVTDSAGQYTIRVTADIKELEFTHISMHTLTMKLPAGNELNVQMSGKGIDLSPVVVTALGIKREAKALSYSRQKMDVDNLISAPATNIASALSGKLAGVQITPPSSNTGSARIIIRGNNSITGNNQPLFVIDGIPVDNEAGDKSQQTSGNNALDYGNVAANINPEDIEGIEVLKGPNASALYGSRAANGVVLITTKKSAGTRFRVTVNSNSTFQRITQFPEYQNVFGAGNSHKLEGSGSTSNPLRIPDIRVFNRSWGAPMVGQPVIGIDGRVKAYLPQEDNVRDFYQTAGMYTNSIAVEGGNAQNSYRFSYTNFKGNSVVAGVNENTRHNANIRMINTLSKAVNFDSKVTYIRNTVENRQYMNGSTKNPIYQYAFMIRDVRLSDYEQYKDEYGNEAGTHRDFLNPYWAINENPNKDTRDQLLTAFNVNVTAAKWLKFTGRLGTEMYWWTGMEFNNRGAQADPDGSLRTFNNQLNNLNADVFATINKQVKDFSLTAVAGASRFQLNTQKRSQRINSLIQAGLMNISNSNEFPTATDVLARKAINSVYGSATIGFRNFLFADVTARNDWSSTLPHGNNSYFYPSFGGTFVFTDAFKGINKKILSFGKLRASYAIVGNDTDPYQLEPTYSFSGIYNDQAYATLASIYYNSDLKPEKTRSFEFGTDLRFFKDRLLLNYTYYHSATTNQIISAQITPSSGFDRKFYNAGQINNWGHEVSVGAVPVENKKFSWNVMVNFATNHSKVVSLIDGVNSFRLNEWFGNAVVYAEVGQPYGIIRGRGWKRDSLGRKLVAADGGVLTTPNSLLGSVLPDWTGGINNSFRIGDFRLSFLVDVRKGGKYYSGTFKRGIQSGAYAITLEGREDYYYHTYILGEDPNLGTSGFIFADAYFEDGRPNDKYLNPLNAFQGKGYFANEELHMFDASYVKLREVVVGYDIPKKLLRKSMFSSARVSLSARNLWIIYQNTPRGMDPEASVTSGNGQGIEYGSLPPNTTYGFDIRFTF